MTKNYIEQESGRSMVEMLGVLAIIGVLSVGGISGYTTAMNKHKANEILNAAAVRAMAVSTQLQNGTPIGDVSLGEFDNENNVGGAVFDDEVQKVSDTQFKIGFVSGSEPSPAVLAQMVNIVGDDSIVQSLEGGLTYNNDLGSEKADIGAEDWIAECDPICGSDAICINGNCVWKPDTEGFGCTSNKDCTGENSNKYCNLTGYKDDSNAVWITNGSCENQSEENEIKININGTIKTFYIPTYMSWWAAQNYCNNFHNGLASLGDLDFTQAGPGNAYDNASDENYTTRWDKVRALIGQTYYWVKNGNKSFTFGAGDGEYNNLPYVVEDNNRYIGNFPICK